MRSMAMAALWFAALSSAAGAQGDGAAAGEATGAAKVRLIVCISVDQMLPDHLTRLAPWFGDGLGRFARAGRVFDRATLLHGDTETGPGHTCIGTGLNPTHHGIVSNDWIGVDASRGTYCYEDREACAVTSDGKREPGFVSPRNLRALGIADRLHALIPGSRAFAISSKDRSAIGMTGQHADLALWWDKQRGGFQTSDWYASELPTWAKEWNAGWVAKLASGEFSQGWKSALPEHFEASRTAPDERDGEPGRAGERSFPHRTPKFTGELSDKERTTAARWVYDGPAGDVLVADLASVAVRELKLGVDDDVDLLAVSLSSCDTVGHGYGPYSVEVTDVLLRADRELARLFHQLDEQVGVDRWVAVLSADHGVLELPEALAARGLDSKRLSGRVMRDTLELVRPTIAKEFGDDFYLTAYPRGVRLSLAKMLAAKVDAAAVRAAYAKELVAAGAMWIEHALTFDQLEAIARRGAEAPTELARFEANSFDEQRTADIVVLQKRMSLVGLPFGTTHGTPYDYDRSIPLAFLGPGVSAAHVDLEAHSIDALPTLFTLAGLPVPEGLDGRALPTR